MTEIVEKELSYRIVGCALEVHRELGFGFHELVYSRSLAVALQLRGIRAQREAPVAVVFRNQVTAHSHDVRDIRVIRMRWST